MSITKITLTKTPQLVATGGCYLQSKGGEFFFSFGTTADTSNCFHDYKLHYDSLFGNIWAWKVVDNEVSLTVAKRKII